MLNQPKRIAFLLRDDSIRFYREVSRLLDSQGFETYWITNNQRWLNYLINNGIKEARVLFIPTYLENNGHRPDHSLIEKLESEIKEFNLSKWILSDRGLKGVDYQIAKNMLVRFSNQLSSLIQKHQIDYLVGELTFSIELLAYTIAKHLGIKFLYPDSIKIPSNRFAFFETPYYGDEFLKNKPEEVHFREAEAVYESWKNNKEKPHFWILNRKPPRPQVNWIAKFFQWQKESDYIMANTGHLAKRKIRELINHFYLKRLPFVRIRDLPEDKKYAIFPLHKQPEASVDITAPEFSNQLATIENIARSLPHNYTLLVKEHEMALGCRGRDFYKKVCALPNVLLLSPYEDSYQALSRCSLVFAIASTMGFEAALLGIPVITFSKVFYHRLNGVKYCPEAGRLTNVIKEHLQTASFDKTKAIDFLAQLIANSHPGVRGHPDVDPNIMKEENIQNWATAFASSVSRDLSS